MDTLPIKKGKVQRCRTCNNDLEDKPWKSHWEANLHYKVNICDRCGKKHWVKVDFLGSGDDDWKPNTEEY